MKNKNTVFLDGIIEECSVISGGDKSLAEMTVVTLHPNVCGTRGEQLSSRYDKFRHDVRVSFDGPGNEFRKMESEINVGFYMRPGISELLCCRLRGALCVEDDGNVFISVDGNSPDGFQRTDSVETINNNFAAVTGKVVSTSYSDGSARISVDIGNGVIDSFTVHETNLVGWDAVASGNIKKGDTVYMSGPLIVGEYSNGEKTLKTCMLSFHEIQNLKQEKRQVPGISYVI